jgi:N-acetylglucosamine-6-sulfatase
MVQSIDLAPTLLEMTGTSTKSRFDGVSLVPIFNGRVREWRTSLFVEYYSDIVFPRIYKMGYKAVRTERYKYIRYEELNDMDELYDLQEDPYEMKNLAQSPNAASVLSSMQRLLKR